MYWSLSIHPKYSYLALIANANAKAEFANSFPSSEIESLMEGTWPYNDLLEVDTSYTICKDTGTKPERMVELLEDIRKTRPAEHIMTLESYWLLLAIQVDQLLVIECILTAILECRGLRGN